MIQKNEIVSSLGGEEIFKFKVGEINHVIIALEPDLLRANHYHMHGQWHIVLGGKITLKLHDTNTDEKSSHDMVQGDSIFVEPYVIHSFRTHEFSVIAENNYEAYKIV